MTPEEQAQRDRIVETGLMKFRRFGIRRVTMDEIARDLRLSKKTLYQQFGSKEELVRACTIKVAETIIPKVVEAFQADEPVDRRILNGFQHFALLPKMISREFIEDIRLEYPQVFDEIDSRRRVIFEMYEELVTVGIKQGVIHKTLHPKFFVKVMLAIMEHVMTPESFVDGGFSPAEAVRSIMTLLTRGLFIQPPDVDIEELVP